MARSEIEELGAWAIALLLDLSRGKHRLDDLAPPRADLVFGAPAEPLSRLLEEVGVPFRLMGFLLYVASPLVRLQMRCDPLAVAEDLDAPPSHAHVDRLVGKCIGDGVRGRVHGYAVIGAHRALHPAPRLEVGRGKGRQHMPLLGQEHPSAAAVGALLEGTGVQLVELLGDCLPDFVRREEPHVAEHEHYALADLADAALDARLVLGLAHACRDDGRPIVRAELLEGAVDPYLVGGMGVYPGLQVVGHYDARVAAEEPERRDVAGDL